MDHREAADTFACERYILGEMTDAERRDFEAHFFSCAECADDVREAALLRDAVRAGLAGAVRPTAAPVVKGRKWRPAIVLPWAVAATLALAVAYLAQPFGRAGDGSAAVIALTPTTIRPADWSTVAVIGAGNAELAVDVADDWHTGELAYTLRTADGTRIAEGTIAAPAPGAPLLLLLSSKFVKPSTHYVLTLQNPRSAILTSEDYRFTVGER